MQAGARASPAFFLLSIDLCGLSPVDLINIKPSARLWGRPTGACAHSDQIALLARTPNARERLMGRR